MTVSKEAFLSPTEFANRYNRTRPLDEDFMPLEPSYVKFLCDQGKITYSVLPSHDGRKKDVYMIPEYELETIDIILNGDKAVKDEPGRVMDTNEVAEFLGRSRADVWLLAREGKLKWRKVHNPNGGSAKYEFDENDVLKFAEEHPKRAYTKRPKPKKDIPELDNSDEIKTLYEMVESLRSTIRELSFENDNLKKRIQDNASKSADKLKELNAVAENLRIANNALLSNNDDLKHQLDHASGNEASNDKDIFEAYRRGFKDGFEMGGVR